MNKKLSNRKKKIRMATFDYINLLLMVLMMIIMVYPFWYTIVGTFNEGSDYMRGGVYF